MKSINLVIPLYNEEVALQENFTKIFNFVQTTPYLFSYQWMIVLTDNGSTDKTKKIAQKITETTNKSQSSIASYYLRLDEKGKGLAIKTAWQKFPADYYIFLDADLSTDLSALPRLIEELENNADIVIGSRYLTGSHTNRSPLRLFISTINRWFAASWLELPLSDFSCGFKGVNQKIIQNILPLIKNKQWFFDTEMLCRAKRAGYTIKEIPVIWTETLNQKRKSKVGLLKVGWEYIKEVIKNRPR